MGFDGFDLLEVILEVEDTFGIAVPCDDAERILTAGDLYGFVRSRIQIVSPDTETRCPSATAFHQMRRKLADQYGIPRRQIRPETRLACILPAQTSDWAAWRQMGATLGVSLRPLQHSRWLFLVALATGASLFFAYSYSLLALIPKASPWSLMHVPAMVLGTFLCPWLVLRVTRRRFAVHVPHGYETVGEVSSLLLHDLLPGQKHQWTSQDVWELVRCSIAKSADIPPAQITKESRWTDLV